MWDNCRQLLIGRDHGLVIPRACQPGDWFGAGKAFLAPLYRKRRLLLDRSKFVFAWTIYNDSVDWSAWEIPKSANEQLHFQIDVKSRKPSGWYFTIPLPIRNRGWLPHAGGSVICEYERQEFNLWTEPAFNEESILEADSS